MMNMGKDSDSLSSSLCGQLLAAVVGVPFIFTETDFFSVGSYRGRCYGYYRNRFGISFAVNWYFENYTACGVADFGYRTYFKSDSCGDSLS